MSQENNMSNSAKGNVDFIVSQGGVVSILENVVDKDNLKNILSDTNIIGLIENIGFTEDGRKKKIRERLILFISNKKDYLPEYKKYEELAIKTINNFPKDSDDFSKGQIGLIVIKAYINFESGRVGFFEEDIQDALDYANGVKYSEGVDLIYQIYLTLTGKSYPSTK